MDFNQLVKFLTAYGYVVVVEEHIDYTNLHYQLAYVSGHRIRASFATRNMNTYKQLNERLAADHERCFDKWSRCPLVMKFPIDGNLLLAHLTWLASEDGFLHSNSYQYLDNPVLPQEMNE